MFCSILQNSTVNKNKSNDFVILFDTMHAFTCYLYKLHCFFFLLSHIKKLFKFYYIINLNITAAGVS